LECLECLEGLELTESKAPKVVKFSKKWPIRESLFPRKYLKF